MQTTWGGADENLRRGLLGFKVSQVPKAGDFAQAGTGHLASSELAHFDRMETVKVGQA
jgi:hypothetical protein